MCDNNFRAIITAWLDVLQRSRDGIRPWNKVQHHAMECNSGISMIHVLLSFIN